VLKFTQSTNPRETPLALVPGCGRGYDVITLADLGFRTWGVDVSQTAIDQAIKYQALATPGGTHGPGSVTWIAHDFFDIERPESGFTIVYDYAFFCSLPPVLRKQWAMKVAELSSPACRLIMLIACKPEDSEDVGPPYSVTADMVSEALEQSQLYGEPGQNWTKILEKKPQIVQGVKAETQSIVVWERK